MAPEGTERGVIVGGSAEAFNFLLCHARGSCQAVVLPSTTLHEILQRVERDPGRAICAEKHQQVAGRLALVR